MGLVHGVVHLGGGQAVAVVGVGLVVLVVGRGVDGEQLLIVLRLLVLY